MVKRLYAANPKTLPRNLLIWATEVTIANLVIATVFTSDVATLLQVWYRNNLEALLSRTNSENRIESSPILAGQYELWSMTFDVMCVMRRAAEPSQLAKTKIEVLRIWQSLDSQFSYNQAAVDDKRCMLDMCQLHCCMLLLCIAVEEDDQASLRKITTTGVKIYCGLPVNRVFYTAVTWSLLVLACAVESTHHRQSFYDKLTTLRNVLGPVSLLRLKHVSERIAELKKVDGSSALDLLRLPCIHTPARGPHMHMLA